MVCVADFGEFRALISFLALGDQLWTINSYLIRALSFVFGS